MNGFPTCLVFCFLIWLLEPAGAYPQSGLILGGRTRRDLSCRDNLEYPNGNICCLNCPAGTYVKSPCTRAGQEGQCEECDYGTFIEHASHLKQCFKCTQCRSDQEIVRPCTHTQNTQCQCKSGRFCDPDEACEVCKKCSRCKNDEEMVRNCTSTTNTECKKKQPKSGSDSVNAVVIVPCLLLAAAGVGVIIFVIYKKRTRTLDSQRSLPDGTKAGMRCIAIPPIEDSGDGETRRPSSTNLSRQLVRTKSSVGMEDERKMLCESLNSSASNSQHSLTSLPSAFPAPAPRASPVVPRQSNRREDQQFPKLVAVKGEESLRKCFEYLEDLDVDQHKRFFRHLGISDNMIKSTEHIAYEDRIHELLNIWVEKEGRDASLNDLLKALLNLNQRRTAEVIKEKAIHNGHYFCEF